MNTSNKSKVHSLAAALYFKGVDRQLKLCQFCKFKVYTFLLVCLLLFAWEDTFYEGSWEHIELLGAFSYQTTGSSNPGEPIDVKPIFGVPGATIIFLEY